MIVSLNVFHFRDECKSQIEKYSGAAFKKFNSEAECKNFIAEKSGGAGASSTALVAPTIERKPNPVAQKALVTNPLSTRKIAVAGKPRSSKFTEPKAQASTSKDPESKELLANLGSHLKRKSTPYHDTRPTKVGRYEFETDKLGFVHVYTDGSCVNNGKLDARAGLGVYFGEDHPL